MLQMFRNTKNHNKIWSNVIQELLSLKKHKKIT